MKKQQVVRTGATSSRYTYDPDTFKHLSNLLNQGYIVVMCNTITKQNGETELEYIVEKECE